MSTYFPEWSFVLTTVVLSCCLSPGSGDSFPETGGQTTTMIAPSENHNHGTAETASWQDSHTNDATVKERIQELYGAVSFPAGKECDWQKLQDLFHKDATIAMPPHPGNLLDVDGFFNDFRDFIARSPAGERGFSERIANMELREFGSVAHALVVYEVRYDPESEEPIQRGVDSIQLVKSNGKWKILSIVTEAERGTLVIPPEFLVKE